MTRWLVVLLAFFIAGCPEKKATPGAPPSGSSATEGKAKRGRTTPTCATQDCATRMIVDDGCTDDGKCMSCVNMCPSDLPKP